NWAHNPAASRRRDQLGDGVRRRIASSPAEDHNSAGPPGEHLRLTLVSQTPQQFRALRHVRMSAQLATVSHSACIVAVHCFRRRRMSYRGSGLLAHGLALRMAAGLGAPYGPVLILRPVGWLWSIRKIWSEGASRYG